MGLENKRVNNETGSSQASQRVLCLWLPNWPIQRLVVALPELRKQRVVLFSQDARRRQIVVAASPLAQFEGVQIDAPLTEAKSLLSRAAYRFRKKHAQPMGASSTGATKTDPSKKMGDKPAAPFFQIFQHVPQDDREALLALAAELDSFSPIVGLQAIPEGQKDEQPDCVFLDITGLTPLFGSESELARQLVNFCQAQGYMARVGIAHTIGLAQGVTQHATNSKSEVNIVPDAVCQRVQLELSSGVSCDSVSRGSVSRGSVSELGRQAEAGDLFRELPIESLRLRPDMAQTLGQLGIFRIGQLLQVPRQELSSRFGQDIYTRLDQMSGKMEEPVQACPRPKEFYAEQLLEHPTNHKETIEVIIERLIQKIVEQLRSSQQGALQWTIRLYGQQKLPLKLHVRLFAPTAQADQVIQLAKMQLEQVLQPELVRRKKKKLSEPAQQDEKPSKKDQWIHRDGRPLDINEITITVSSSVLLESRQRELFDESPRADRQALAHLINRLSGRLGHRNVVVPSMVAGNQPEYCYQLKPLVHSAGRSGKRTQAPMDSSHVIGRPIRMLHPALPIEVVALSPSSETGPEARHPGMGVARSTVPVVITLKQRKRKVSQYWGPERIETGWWRGNLVRRDYWKVELDTHQQFWIYFDLRKQRWFLQGEF